MKLKNGMAKPDSKTFGAPVKGITKDEFLARCANAYEMGLIDPGQMALMERWLDFVMRFEHTLLSHGQSQGIYAMDFLEGERARLNGSTLANDSSGYGLIRFAAILSHPCQECAADPTAWHTRSAFCEHKRMNRAENENW